jgi:LEA14-like dessication related protein
LSPVRFIEIDFQKVAFEISLRIDNPNYISLNFSRVSYSLRLDNEAVLNGMLNEGVNVPAKEQGQIFVPIEVQLSTLSMGAVNFMLKRKVSYHFELFLYPDIPIVERKSVKHERSGILTF